MDLLTFQNLELLRFFQQRSGRSLHRRHCAWVTIVLTRTGNRKTQRNLTNERHSCTLISNQRKVDSTIFNVNGDQVLQLFLNSWCRCNLELCLNYKFIKCTESLGYFLLGCKCLPVDISHLISLILSECVETSKQSHMLEIVFMMYIYILKWKGHMIKMVDLNKLCLISYFIVFWNIPGVNTKECLNVYNCNDLHFKL